jgi:hypothetical protein
MLRNTENLNSVALILSDLNIGLVVGTGSAIAHDLHLRERLHEMPMEEFPGQPMLGKRPADPQPDATMTYPGGGFADSADTLRAAASASASPTARAESAIYSPGIKQHTARTQQKRQHWRCSRVMPGRSGDVVVAPVCCSAVVSG